MLDRNAFGLLVLRTGGSDKIGMDMDRSDNRQDRRDRSGGHRHRAYSLLELLSAIAILALLAAILVPVLSAARERSRRASCAANLHSLHLALAAYLSDYDGQYPPDSPTGRNYVGRSPHWIATHPYWYEVLATYLRAARFPTCPDNPPTPWLIRDSRDVPKGRTCGYAYNSRLRRLVKPSAPGQPYREIGLAESAIASLTDVVVFFDSRPGVGSTDRPDTLARLDELRGLNIYENQHQWESVPPGAFRHSGGANYVFGDGHLRWLRPEQLTPANFLRSK
jgi:prepilin-type processing-associated H-X9-DG protein/prepilin-type N-terminal cleavage/methylation domain-containing protein